MLVVVFGWQVGLLAAFVHVNLYLGGSAAVNAIGHHFGRRPYDNSAGNLQWLAFITAGEGLHNNHHAAPTSAKLAHRWFEIDPGWYVIKALTWARSGEGPPQRPPADRGRPPARGRLIGVPEAHLPSASSRSFQLMRWSRKAST